MKTANGMAILGCALTFPSARWIKRPVAPWRGRRGRVKRKSVRSTVQGAVVGGGIGAMTEHGDKGKAARTGRAIGAAVGQVPRRYRQQRAAGRGAGRRGGRHDRESQPLTLLQPYCAAIRLTAASRRCCALPL